jgi:hypothetical protein
MRPGDDVDGTNTVGWVDTTVGVTVGSDEGGRVGI